jgi:polysaccharide export outer membrane protein
MRGARSLLLLPLALAAAGCSRHSQSYVVYDPNTGQQYMTTALPQAASPQPSQGFELYGQPSGASYAQAGAAQQSYAQTTPPKASTEISQNDIPNRGLFTQRRSSSTYVAPQPQQQPYVVQYGAGTYAQQPAPAYVAPAYPATAPTYAAPPARTYVQPPAYAPQAYAQPNYGYASTSAYAPSYSLDSGDKLRIVVFGQEGLTNSYVVDAGGNINMPLVGTLPARGVTTQQLVGLITQRLKQGYVREPHVSVEVETYRPFFILGEVNNPGQYPYVANMTAEAAVAIAGGFSPRADKKKVELTRNGAGQQIHGQVPLNYALKPGDTVVVKERWF